MILELFTKFDFFNTTNKILIHNKKWPTYLVDLTETKIPAGWVSLQICILSLTLYSLWILTFLRKRVKLLYLFSFTHLNTEPLCSRHHHFFLLKCTSEGYPQIAWQRVTAQNTSLPQNWSHCQQKTSIAFCQPVQPHFGYFPENIYVPLVSSFLHNILI